MKKRKFNKELQEKIEIVLVINFIKMQAIQCLELIMRNSKNNNISRAILN